MTLTIPMFWIGFVVGIVTLFLIAILLGVRRGWRKKK